MENTCNTLGSDFWAGGVGGGVNLDLCAWGADLGWEAPWVWWDGDTNHMGLACLLGIVEYVIGGDATLVQLVRDCAWLGVCMGFLEWAIAGIDGRTASELHCLQASTTFVLIIEGIMGFASVITESESLITWGLLFDDCNGIGFRASISLLEQCETGRGKNDKSTRVDKTQWQESKMTTQERRVKSTWTGTRGTSL